MYFPIAVRKSRKDQCFERIHNSHVFQKGRGGRGEGKQGQEKNVGVYIYLNI